MPDRPARLVVVAGTGTEVGKTWVTARLAAVARASGTRVGARKPVQSFDPAGGPTDRDVLAQATDDSPDDVCAPHRSYAVPMAPFMAADRLGLPPFTLAELVAELTWPTGLDLGLIEAAGGVRSPMTSDGADTVDLVAALDPDDVVLVGDAGLGTINAVRLCTDVLADRALTVVLNRFHPADELHAANYEWLVAHLGVPVVTDVTALLR